MVTMPDADAVVVGSGPNGLAAAVTLARAGLRVTVVEADDHPGGGARTEALTLPGFHHDVCSAVHPLAIESEFFRRFRLRERIPFAVPELSFAHALHGGQAALAYRDLDRTAAGLGADGPAYQRLIAPLSRRATELADLTGSTLARVPTPLTLATRFGLAVAERGGPAAIRRFREATAPALLAGAEAHAILPLPSLGAAAAGLVLAAYAHAEGWPIPLGGSGSITAALIDDLEAHGGRVVTGQRIRSLRELPPARAVLLDVTPRALLALAGDRLPRAYRRQMRQFRYGSAIAKVDFALSEPVPWTHPELHRAGTIHLGGTRGEVATSLRDVAQGRIPQIPFVLAAQPTVFDPSRAPDGQHVLWSYTHVPAGCGADRADAVRDRIEQFAPGFRDTILGVSSRSALEVSRHNPNYIGGDISAGAADVGQLLRRPVFARDPWRIPFPGLYLASASASPGPGVHGLAGWHAARSALRHEFGVTEAPSLAPGSAPGSADGDAAWR